MIGTEIRLGDCKEGEFYNFSYDLDLLTLFILTRDNNDNYYAKWVTGSSAGGHIAGGDERVVYCHPLSPLMKALL
jgi:hypothetical protein